MIMKKDESLGGGRADLLRAAAGAAERHEFGRGLIARARPDRRGAAGAECG